ncbi:hypothetical protein R1sor_024012 [Riccia sorocarpa]|uniref:Transmembrane protein n=1 Tax=Riccia sorocarpa TaxID=122646 RepID=A0ABD3GTB8_9MARC
MVEFETVVFLVPFSGLAMLLLIGAVTSRVRRCLACGRLQTDSGRPESPPTPPKVDVSFQTWLSSSPPAADTPEEPEVPKLELPPAFHYEMPSDFRRLRYSPTGGNDDEDEIMVEREIGETSGASTSYWRGGAPSASPPRLQVSPQRRRETGDDLRRTVLISRAMQTLPENHTLLRTPSRRDTPPTPRRTELSRPVRPQGEVAPESSLRARGPPRSLRTWNSAPASPSASRRVSVSVPIRIHEPSTSPRTQRALHWVSSTSPRRSEAEPTPSTQEGIRITAVSEAEPIPVTPEAITPSEVARRRPVGIRISEPEVRSPDEPTASTGSSEKPPAPEDPKGKRPMYE